MGHKRLYFNGKWSDELDLVIQSDPVYNYPEKDVTATHVPGRNGDILIDTGSYKNVSRSYSLGVGFKSGTTFISNSEEIIQWLKTADGYSRLEDDYDPDVYRYARYSASGSLTNLYDEATTISVQFECKPQRFLKDGENEMDISVPSGVIVNPTEYEALPKIEIDNIPSDAGNIMLSIINDDYTNIVTINSIVNSKVTIDSETQEVYDPDTDKSLSSMVNINDGTFPVLKGGTTEIKTQLFSDTTTDIPTYKKIIENNQSVLTIKYEPYQTTLETKQNRIVIPSLNARKISVQESYYARAYSALALDKAESYTFVSFNTIISQQAKSITFVAGDDDVNDLTGGWLSSAESDGVYSFSLSSDYGGWVFISGFSKWTFFKTGEVVLSGVKSGTITTIQYIPSKSANGVDADGYADMDIVGYSSKPDWVNARVKLNDDKTISGIIYEACKAGYYYIEKSGLLSSAKWIQLNDGETYQLGKISWSSWKKAFISYEGLSSSTTATYTYRYLDSTPQYEDVTEEQTDSNGNTKKVVTSKVHFTVSGTVLNPTFKIKDSGWYRCNNSGYKDSDTTSTHSAWVYLDEGATMPTGFNTSTSEANNIYYIEDDSVVNYKKVSSWPDWLDPVPNIVSSDNILTATSINFKVLKDAFYRYTYIETNSQGTEEEKMTDFKEVSSGTYLDTNTKPTDSQTICEIDGMPTDWSNQYNLTFNGGSAENIPSWCTFVWFPVATDDDPDATPMEWDPSTKSFVKSNRTKQSEDNKDIATYELISNANGVYRLDENLMWVSHVVEVFISSSKYSDDTTLKYLSATPHYPENDFFTDVIASDETGNFTGVTIQAKKEGFYKLGTNTSWTKYSVGDSITSFDTDESNTLMYMTPVDLKDNITVKIRPNWWML